MHLHQLIEQDFENIFSSILKNDQLEISTESLFDHRNLYSIEKLYAIEGVRVPGVNEEERISLIDFVILWDEIEQLWEPDEEITRKLLGFINKYQGIKSFEFFFIYYKLMSFTEGDNCKDDIEDFYRLIIENHSEIVKLDDFIEKSDFHLPILLIDTPSTSIIKLFQEYYSKFPEKAMVKSLLSYLYEKIGNIKSSIEFHLQFLGQIEADRVYNKSKNILEFSGDGITIEDYHLTLSNLSRLFYQNEDFNHALEYSQKCLNEFKLRNEDVYSFQVLFLDPLIIKLRVLMKRSDGDRFKQNFELLKLKVDPQDFEELNIPDIKEYAKKLKM